MWKKLMVFCFVVIMQSCALMPSEHRQARNADILNRFSGHVITAVKAGKFGDTYLVLRKNKTFIYRENVFGVFVNYYSGTYTLEGNNLNLLYNFTAAGLGDTLVISADTDGTPCFEAANKDIFSIKDKNMYRVIAGL